MAIGDDLFTMLGLIPSRDRAGIARGTMADEAKASMAANGNAEGRALMDGGARPPAISLPPQMRGGGDVQLPDDVATSYAAGKGGGGGPSIIPQVLPPSQDRVVAAGPAAAPPPAVKRNSDIILEAIQQQQRQQRLQQLIGGIGQMISASQGHASQPAASGGGGGGGDLSTLKSLLEMRDAETDKERIIEHAKRTQRLTDADARALHAQGQLAGRNAPDQLLKIEDRNRVQGTRDMLLKDAAGNAAAVGMPEHAWRTLVENDPKGAAELLTPDKLEGARQKTLQNKDTAAAQEARMAEVARLRKSGASDEDLITAWDPEAAKTIFKKRAEIGAGAGHEAAKVAYDEFIKKDHETAKAQESYLRGSAQEIGKLWHPGLITGTWAEFRQSALHRPVMTFLEKFGYNSENVNSTAQLKSILAKITTENVKTIPGPAGVKDVILASTISGNEQMTPREIRAVGAMIESINRQGIITHNEKADAMEVTSPEMGRHFRQVRRIDMPEPSKILRDNVNAPGNDKLKNDMRLAAQQLKAAKGTPEYTDAHAEYKKMSSIFDNAFGPGMGEWFTKLPPKEAKP